MFVYNLCLKYAAPAAFGKSKQFESGKQAKKAAEMISSMREEQRKREQESKTPAQQEEIRRQKAAQAELRGPSLMEAHTVDRKRRQEEGGKGGKRRNVGREPKESKPRNRQHYTGEGIDSDGDDNYQMGGGYGDDEPAGGRQAFDREQVRHYHYCNRTFFL